MSRFVSEDRRGVPSASGLERLTLCPGSWRMERGIPLSVGQGPRADLGNRMHEVLAGARAKEDLSASQREVVRRGLALAEQVIESLDLSGSEARRLVEERLWMHYREGGPAFSARVDLAVVCGDRGLVLDYKTGSSFITDPSDNRQLHAQAVLLSRHYSLSSVDAAIVQPLVAQPISVTRFDAPRLAELEREIFAALRAAAVEDAPLVPGPVQCRHCRARRHCPEFRR